MIDYSKIIIEGGFSLLVGVLFANIVLSFVKDKKNSDVIEEIKSSSEKTIRELQLQNEKMLNILEDMKHLLKLSLNNNSLENIKIIIENRVQKIEKFLKKKIDINNIDERSLEHDKIQIKTQIEKEMNIMLNSIKKNVYIKDNEQIKEWFLLFNDTINTLIENIVKDENHNEFEHKKSNKAKVETFIEDLLTNVFEVIEREINH